jgi:organic hydroperoxide reductase OsmC/OhrA
VIAAQYGLGSLDEPAFVEHAQAAEAGCPVSRALAGVTLTASLVQ